MSKRAITHLQTDPVMSSLIGKIGPIRLKPRRLSPFQSLTQAIIHQQLSGKAAGTILERFQQLFPNGAFPTPDLVSKMAPEKLRAAGLSRPKAGYILDLARRCEAGLLPSLEDCVLLEDEAIIAQLTEIKGIVFREAFPANTAAYEAACKEGKVRVGKMFVTENRALSGPRWIINFPTKKHWRHPSKLEWIRDGLADLRRVIGEKHIHSIALPPLGCGNGGLEWSQVRATIDAELSPLDNVNVVVFAPTSTYQNAAKRKGVDELTPARAMVAEMVRRYSILGIQCTNLEVQKLAWFLQRMINGLHLDNPLKLTFEANKYGPYADYLRHLLNGLDGSYLHCEKRLADAGPLEPIWFEDSKCENVRDYLFSQAARKYLPALERTADVIDGFESPLGMELLGTVDWLLSQEKRAATVPAMREGLMEWPGGPTAAQRKQKLFTDAWLELALRRLTNPTLLPQPSLNLG